MPWFFFSHASDNRHKHLRRFYDDLLDQVGQNLAPPHNASPGFVDWQNLHLMDSWNDALQTALEQSRVLVCLTSPAYVVKEFCGREVALFDHQRRHLLQPGQKLPDVVLPILWVKTGSLPDIFSSAQFNHGDLQNYEDLGLFNIMNLGKWGLYRRCLNAFVEAIREKGEAHPPRPPVPGARLATIPSAFGSQRVFRTKFLFFAGRKQDFAGQPRENSYGDARSYHWLPFHPPELKSVGECAELAAGKHNVPFEEIPHDAQALASIRQARARNEGVVIVADPWTANSPTYRGNLAGLDPKLDTNTALIVPWNQHDLETVRNRAVLESAIHDSLEGRSPIYRSGIQSTQELQDELDRAIAVLKQKAVSQEADKRPVTDSMVTVAGPGGTNH